MPTHDPSRARKLPRRRRKVVSVGDENGIQSPFIAEQHSAGRRVNITDWAPLLMANDYTPFLEMESEASFS